VPGASESTARYETLTNSRSERFDLLTVPGAEARGHFVQSSEHDGFLVESISHFAANALGAGDACLLIATDFRLRSIDLQLSKHGFDLNPALPDRTLCCIGCG
jgi:hypothetical protein